MMNSICLRALLVASVLVYGKASDAWKSKVARVASCEQGVDILFVQDTTGSLQSSLDRMTAEVVDLLREIAKSFVHTRAGVVQFKDKPIDPMGVPGYDFCYRLGQSLTTNMTAVRSTYATYEASGGGDSPEATYHALWDVTRDARIGWRPFAKSKVLKPDVTAARIVVLLTDAQPHFAGSLEMPPFPGTSQTAEEFDSECLHNDYPTPQIIKKALDDKETLLVSLIAKDPHIDAYPAWSWVNEALLEQPASFCARVKDGAADLTVRIKEIFELIRAEIPCEQTTTTPGPTTTVTTTTTATSKSTDVQSSSPVTSESTTLTTATTPTAALTSTEPTNPATLTWASTETTEASGDDGSSSCSCKCHGCGCGCGCGCSHNCSGNAPKFVFNIPAGVVSADISVKDIREGLANLPTL